MDEPFPSRPRLFFVAAARILAGIILISCMLFLPAGTLAFWQAWLYMGVLFVPLAIVATTLLLKDPELLERRMRMRETEAAQKKAIAWSSILLLAVFLIPGFDHRHTWSRVPAALVLIADVGVLLGYLLFALVIRENRYASRVVEVQQGQVVLSTGPYSVVRHPMYLAVSVMFGLTPLALGSYWGLIPALLLPLVLARRIDNEEQLLLRELSGYEEYRRKVRFRLFPFVW